MGCKKVKKVFKKIGNTVKKIVKSPVGKLALAGAAIYTGGAALGAWGGAAEAGAVAAGAGAATGAGSFAGALGAGVVEGAGTAGFFSTGTSLAVTTGVSEYAAAAVAGSSSGALSFGSALVADTALTSAGIASGALTATEVLKGVKLATDVVGNVVKIGADSKPLQLMPSSVSGSLRAGVPGQLSTGRYNFPTAASNEVMEGKTPAQVNSQIFVIAGILVGAAFLFTGVRK